MDRFLFVSYDSTLGLEEKTQSETDKKVIKVDQEKRFASGLCRNFGKYKFLNYQRFGNRFD